MRLQFGFRCGVPRVPQAKGNHVYAAYLKRHALWLDMTRLVLDREADLLLL